MGLPPHPSPPQFPRDLRAAPTLPGLANPPLEGVRLARLSSVHSAKRSVCPKEPVNTCISDPLHSISNVKPHCPQLNGVPDPIFTNGHKAWSPWRTVVCHLTPSPLTFGQQGRLCPGLRPAQSEKVMAQFFRICSDCSQKKNRFGENELKMQPKLSTGYSHAAELNKV